MIELMHRTATRKKITFGLVMVGLLAACLFTATVVNAIAQGYATSDTALQPGMTVALIQTANNQQEAARATQETQVNIIGIATPVGDNLVTVATKDDHVFVQTTGQVSAYVSDFNGTIKKDDRLVISPINGVLMQATNTKNTVIAVALDDFSSATNVETKSVQSDRGPRSITIGKIKVSLDYKVNAKTDQNGALQRLGRAIVGKQVTATRVIAAIVIFIIVLVVEGGIIYGAVSSAMTALGRNPLARKIIHQETLRVVIVAFFVLLAGVGAVYLILWL